MTAAAVRLRPATEADCDRLFAWINDRDARAAAIKGPAPIPYETHVAWLAARLADPDCRLWIIECDGLAVGQVRLQGDESGREVSIFVDRAARRRGIAGEAIEQALAAFGGRLAHARVRTTNTASRRLFESLGFRLAAEQPEFIVYVRAAAGEHQRPRTAVGR